MNASQKSELEQIYGTPFIDKKAPGYYPVLRAFKTPILKSNILLDKAAFYIRERMAIESAIKELAFAMVALATYVFMQYLGRIVSLQGFGSLISLALISAIVYNFFKASLKSLTPGLIFLVGGLVLLETNIHHQYFKFISSHAVDYIIGTGALFIALALFKTEKN
ncbi:hypothetical protein [Legionella feeleii]|uniref:Transmembrane protein n=1 Tax=Legionella feeleii TaxID=453 RepID=A0A378IWI2_9GAMM|nr:hypothetical protein [Legionella feeleii]STX39280.1 Uncharacterised protein [Legionella feeleii]